MSSTEQLLSKMAEDTPFEEQMEQGEELLKNLDYSAALRHYDRVLKSAQKITTDDRDFKVARARNRYARSCQVVGRWDRAQREYRRVVESELEGEERSAVAEALLGLGLTLSRRGERDEAKDHFEEAREVAEELNLDYRKAEALCHIDCFFFSALGLLVEKGCHPLRGVIRHQPGALVGEERVRHCV